MDWTIEFDKAIEQYLPDLEVLQDEPMSRHTTFRIGGPTRVMALPKQKKRQSKRCGWPCVMGFSPFIWEMEVTCWSPTRATRDSF